MEEPANQRRPEPKRGALTKIKDLVMKNFFKV